MATLTADNGKLLIEGRVVIKGYESVTGWNWFATEVSGTQDSVIDGEVYPNDTIFFGYVQGFCDEWGCFSKTELELMRPLVWEIPPHNLPYAGRRN